MAKKIEWTVRVVNFEDQPDTARMLRNHLPGVWAEQLRYMGHVKEITSLEKPDRTVLEFYCPEPGKHDTHVWAEQNASRMRSFGIDAAPAPKWATESGHWTDPESHNRPLRSRHGQ